MRLFGRDELLALLRKSDAHLCESRSLLLVGGCAVLVLCEDALVTRDLDVFPIDGLEDVIEAVKMASRESTTPIDINTASAAFETYLPEGWEDRQVLSTTFSTDHIKVFTPAPVDIAVMKVFRFNEKDVKDIIRLARLESFSGQAFQERFLGVLPVAIGDLRWHAQSFSIIWSELYPEEKLSTDDILEQANIFV